MESLLPDIALEDIHEMSLQDVCIEILNDKTNSFTANERQSLRKLLISYEMFRKFAYKTIDTREVEINKFIDTCLKHMRYKVLNPSEILLEKEQKNHSLYFIIKGNLGVYVPKPTEVLRNEIEAAKKKKTQKFSRNAEAKSPRNLEKSPKSTFVLSRKTTETLDKLITADEVLKVRLHSNLVSGQQIGEEILAGNVVCENTIAAVEKTHLLELPLKLYFKAINEYHKLFQQRMKIIQSSFPNVNDKMLSKLVCYFTEQRLVSEQRIFQEGSPSGRMYCLLYGEIKLSKKKSRVKIGSKKNEISKVEEVEIDTVKSGEFFGDEIIFEEEFRGHTAISGVKDVLVLSLDKEALRKMQRAYPEPMEKFRQMLKIKRDIRMKHSSFLSNALKGEVYLHLSDIVKETLQTPESKFLTLKQHDKNKNLNVRNNLDDKKDPFTISPPFARTQSFMKTGFSADVRAKLTTATIMNPGIPNETARDDKIRWDETRFRFTPSPGDRFFHMTSRKSSNSRVDTESGEKTSFPNDYLLRPSPSQKISLNRKRSTQAFGTFYMKQSYSPRTPSNGLGKTFYSANNRFDFFTQVGHISERVGIPEQNASTSRDRYLYTFDEQCERLNKVSSDIDKLSSTIVRSIRNIRNSGDETSTPKEMSSSRKAHHKEDAVKAKTLEDYIKCIEDEPVLHAKYLEISPRKNSLKSALRTETSHEARQKDPRAKDTILADSFSAPKASRIKIP